MTIDQTTRNNLKNYAESLLLDHLHFVVMTNFSKIQEKNRYRNWYLGYTKIQGPVGYNGGDITSKCNWKQFDTSATEGEIFTDAFGNKFDVDKVEPDIKIEIQIFHNTGPKTFAGWLKLPSGKLSKPQPNHNSTIT